MTISKALPRFKLLSGLALSLVLAGTVYSQPSNKNVELIDPENGVFRILGLVDISPSGDAIQLWRSEDVNDEYGVGTQFIGVDEATQTVASIIIVLDSSKNAEEPDVSQMRQNDVETIDNQLRGKAERDAERQGFSFGKWLSSSLNEPDDFPGTKFLTTAYTFGAGGNERLVFEARATINGKKVYIRSMAPAENQEIVGQNFATITSAIVMSQMRGRAIDGRTDAQVDGPVAEESKKVDSPDGATISLVCSGMHTSTKMNWETMKIDKNEHEWNNEFAIDLEQQRLLRYQSYWIEPNPSRVEISATTIKIFDQTTMDVSEDSDSSPDLRDATLVYTISRMDGSFKAGCIDFPCGMTITGECIDAKKRAF